MLMRLPTLVELNSGRVAVVEVEYTELPKINPSQRKFVDEYMVCGNATAAAIRAGYAASTGGSLINNPDIAAHVSWHRAKVRDAYDISKESLLRELGKIVGANLDDYLKLDPVTGEKVWDFSMVQRDHMAAVSEYSTEQNKFGRKVKIKMHDKLGAIEKIAKMLGYNEPDKVQAVNYNANVTVDMTPQEAAEAYRRMREAS